VSNWASYIIWGITARIRGIAADTPEPPVVVDMDTALADEINKATTLDELKNALTGKNGIVKVKGEKK